MVPGPEPHLLSSCPLEKHFTSTNGVCFFAMFKNKSVILHVCLYKYILHKLATLCHVENTTFKHWAALKTSNSCLELAVTNLMDLSDRVSYRHCVNFIPYYLPWTVSDFLEIADYIGFPIR